MNERGRVLHAERGTFVRREASIGAPEQLRAHAPPTPLFAHGLKCSALSPHEQHGLGQGCKRKLNLALVQLVPTHSIAHGPHGFERLDQGAYLAHGRART